jgi:hypothetical protein
LPKLQMSVGRMTMDEEALNTSVRKFLRKFGVMAQRQLETAVRAPDAKGQLKGSDPLPVKAVVTVGGIDLKLRSTAISSCREADRVLSKDEPR